MKSTIAKRILSLFLVLVLALGLAGCGLVDSVVGLFKGSSGEDEDAVTDAVYATAGGSIQLPEGLARAGTERRHEHPVHRGPAGPVRSI